MRTRAHASRTGHLRREIAALAARMIAEDGIADFGFAKRKAARQLGISDADTLPNNAEIEAELRLYQSLYQDEEHVERLQEMRRAAVEVMRLLADFRPYLTGAVLEGTAGRYSEVDIELFPDSAKDVEIFFLNQEISYEHRDVRRAPDAPEAILVFDWDEVPVRLTIRDTLSERGNRRGAPHRPSERARLAQVEELLAAALTPTEPEA